MQQWLQTLLAALAEFAGEEDESDVLDDNAGRMLVAAPESMFGPMLVYDTTNKKGEHLRVLSLNGMHESAMFLDESRFSDLVFPYTRLYDTMFQANISIERVLMIGGGGYSYPKHLISTHPEVRLDVVEIDPVMTRTAKEFFGLNKLINAYCADDPSRLGLINEDGRAFLEQRASDADAPRYDAVLNDSFAGGVHVPSLASLEAAQAVKRCLAPHGIYMSNIIGSLSGQDSQFLHAEANTFAQVFDHIWVIPSRNRKDWMRDNYLFIATDEPCEFAQGKRFAPRENGLIITDENNPTVSIGNIED